MNFFKNIRLLVLLFLYQNYAYRAVDQFLNDSFFQNPAELQNTDDIQFILGNLFISPSLEFTGTTNFGNGKVNSKANNFLPYTLIEKRFTNKLVLGLNIIPTGYGHIEWPLNSIISHDSTTTELLYYRLGTQLSYQFTNNLSVGFGFNIHDEYLSELNFVVSGLGNQINKVNGLNYSGDVGLYYQINKKHYFTACYYSPINTFGHGTSSIGQTVSPNFSLSLYEAAVAFIGLQHFLSDKWFLEEKIYWSGWSINKKVSFINTTTGSFSNPANWYDTWSFQITSKYGLWEKIAIIGSAIYETNPVPIATNQVGYPLAPSGGLSVGIELNIKNNLSMQMMYGYGAFIPNAIIDNATANGSASANFQTFVLQFTYKT